MTPEPDSAPADSAAQAAKAILARLYAPILPELKQVEEMYRAELSSDDEYIANLLEYIEDYSGKKLRPALLLLAGKACGKVTHDHIILGVVAEMLHTATLVHDDILDEALLRRKRAADVEHLGHAFGIIMLGEVSAGRLEPGVCPAVLPLETAEFAGGQFAPGQGRGVTHARGQFQRLCIERAGLVPMPHQLFHLTEL